MAGFDSEVLNWKVRAVAAGGTISDATLLAANTFMLSIKASSLRSKILRLNLMAGDRVASLVPLIKDAGNATDNAFVASSYSESVGWTMNNQFEFISTGFNPNTSLTTNDAHLAIYLGGTSAAATWIPMGTTGATDFYLTTSYTALGFVTNIWSGTGRPVLADSNGTGFYLGTRISSSSTGVTIHKNGALVGTSTLVGGTPPNAPVYVMNCESAGLALGGAPNNKNGRGYQMGTGVTTGDSTTFYNAWQAFQTALGRQV